VLAAFALLLLVNWLGFRHWSRGDWTKAKLYALSDTTRKVVKGLQTPVDVTVFMTRDSRVFPAVQELLTRYQALSKEVRVEYLDPRRNLARAQALVNEYQVRQNTVVFKAGDRKKYVTEDQIADFDFGGMPGQGGGGIKALKGEQAFTSAILAVTSQKSPKIYFAAGHGEKSPDDGGEDGMSQAKELLTKDNDSPQSWQSLGKGEVPKDADLVVVAGPRTAFLDPEISALDHYLSSGGHVLFLLDPVLPKPGGPKTDFGLSGLLASWGVKLDNDIVVDPGNALPFMGAETVYANHFGGHEIVAPLS
jgi:gliding motility-associatede transport system auxiliary component